MTGYRDIIIRETADGPEIVCMPGAESGLVPVLSLTEDNLELLMQRIIERRGTADAALRRLLDRARLLMLLTEYGEAKFGDEWWPGNAGDWIGEAKGLELARLLDPGVEPLGVRYPGGENDAQVIAAADVRTRQAEVARRAAELDQVPAGSSFLARAAGRLFRISPQRAFGASDDWWVPVDCRDVRTGMESQAIVRAASAAARASLLAEQQVRDAVKSAYLHATMQEAGTYPAGGVLLPAGFVIELSSGPV